MEVAGENPGGLISKKKHRTPALETRRPPDAPPPAVNSYLRRPDIFNGTIALSGLYSSGMFFGSYMDDLVYRNSPCDYMRNFPTTHPYMKLFEKADKFIMCCGQGAWEADLLASTKELQAILESKGIHPIVDIWGQDVSHDWYWWEKQWVYFLQMTLGDA